MAHHVVFEVSIADDGGATSDIWLADVTATGLRAGMRVTNAETVGQGANNADVAWSKSFERALVTFHRGLLPFAQLFEMTGEPPFNQVLGSAFPVPFGIGTSLGALDAHPSDGSFLFAMAGPYPGLRIVRVSGQTIVEQSTIPTIQPSTLFGDPAASFDARHDCSPASCGCYLVGYGDAPPPIPNAQGTVRAYHTCMSPVNNTAPVARAGPDLLTVPEGAVFQLDGSDSGDSDGDPLRYRWTQLPLRVRATFLDPEGPVAVQPRLRAPVLDPTVSSVDLTFELQVDDFRSNPAFHATDNVKVTVISATDPHPPTAKAGVDQNADEGATVQLDGCGSVDVDNEPISFAWSLDRVTPVVAFSEPISLSDAGTCSPSFRVPRFAQAGGTKLTFRLDVFSERGGRGTDYVTISVADIINELPRADARASQTVMENVPFVLDASGSSDPNGDHLTYRWEFLGYGDDVSVSIDDKTAVAPHVVATVWYTMTLHFRVTVSDRRGGTDAAEVAIQVEQAPLAVTSYTPASGSPGTEVIIRGTGLDSLRGGFGRVYFGAPGCAYCGGRITSLSDSELRVVVPAGEPKARGWYVGSAGTGRLEVEDYMYGVKSSPIVVTDGHTTWSSAPAQFIISHVEISDVRLSQGEDNYELVRGKDAVLQVEVRTYESAPAALASLSAATLTMVPDGGSPVTVPATHVPAQAMANTGIVTMETQAVYFLIDGAMLTTARCPTLDITLQNNGEVIARAKTLLHDGRSALYSALPKLRILLVPIVPFSNGTVDPSAFNPTKFAAQRQEAEALIRRVYPFDDVEFITWQNYHGGEEFPELMRSTDGRILIVGFEDVSGFWNETRPGFNKLEDMLGEYNDQHPDASAQLVMGLIDPQEYSPQSTNSGIAWGPDEFNWEIGEWYLDNVSGGFLGFEKIPWYVVLLDIFVPGISGLLIPGYFASLAAVLASLPSTPVAFALVSSLSTPAHEMGHMLGFVRPGLGAVHDSDNPTHSVFDECLHQLQIPYALCPFHFRPGHPLFNAQTGVMMDPQVTLNPAVVIQERKPKSLMAYSRNPPWVQTNPGKRTLANTFLESYQWNDLVHRYQLVEAPSSSLAANATASNARAAKHPQKKMRISGFVDPVTQQAVIYKLARVPETAAETLRPNSSPLVLEYDGGAPRGQVPLRFDVPLRLVQAPAPAQAEVLDPHVVFSAVVALPVKVSKLRVKWFDKVVWSASASESAPTLSIVTPAGGESFADGAEMAIRWRASDPDGDSLIYEVYYSRDGGATFDPIQTAVISTEVRWAIAAGAGSEIGVIKVVATDGFNIGEAVSNVFHVASKAPRGSVLSPSDDARFVSSLPIVLEGTADFPGQMTVNDATAYAWSSSVDGPLGNGRRLVMSQLSPGAHEIELRVVVGDKTDRASVRIEVLEDRDGDGVSDAAEEASGVLDPDNASDAFQDRDGDGLLDGAEVAQTATDPFDPDSDDDGIPDGTQYRVGNLPGFSCDPSACDDGDACTTDSCGPFMSCEHAHIPGIDGAKCEVTKMLAADLCKGDALSPRLQATIARRAATSLRQLDKATKASTAKQVNRIVNGVDKQLARLLRMIAKAPGRKVADRCRVRLTSMVGRSCVVLRQLEQ